MKRMQAFGMFFPVFLALTLLVACTTARTIRLEEERIYGDPKADEDTLRRHKAAIDPARPPEELFQKGYKSYILGDRDMALAYFLVLIEAHSHTKYFSDSAYNAGLIYQRRGDWEGAVSMFEHAAETGKKSKDVLDARFQILACYHEMGKWNEILAFTGSIRDKHKVLTADDKVELDVRDGVASFELGKTEKAENLLELAFTDYKVGVRRGDVFNDYMGGMAAYYLGLVERKRFDSVRLSLATRPKMEAQLEKKAGHLLTAQEHFLESIQQDDAFWATASGMQIGKLYKDLYLEMKDTDLPPELAGDPEDARAYRCMLSEKVQVLLKKAMHVYDRTLDMGERLRVRNRFVEQTKLDLEKTKQMYLDDLKACEGVLPENWEELKGEKDES